MDPNTQVIEDADYEEVEDNSEEILEDEDSGQPEAQEDVTEDVKDVDEGEEAKDEEPQEQEFRELKDFAEALEVDVEDLLDQIQTTVKINGEEIPVTLKELHSGYQKDADYRQKTSEVAETRRQFEDLVGTLNNRYAERIQEVEALASSLEESFMEDYNSIDWDKLRREDPANFAVLKQDMEDRKQHIANAKLKTHMDRQKQQEEYLQFVKTQAVPQEMAKLVEYNPDWKDRGKWNEDYQSILNSLVHNYGFSPEEASNTYDNRMLRVAWDAYRYNNSKQQKASGVKQIKEEIASKKKKLSKVLKPGANKPRTSGQTKRIQAAQVKLKKSGSVDDAAALILERMNTR